MRALVTGGTGFIGYNLVQELLSLNYEVIITGNDTENKLPNGVQVLYPSLVGINWKQLKNIDIVFHQAALNLTTCNDEEEMLNANVDSTIKLVYHCLNEGCKRFVYASSTAVYGDNPIPYKELDTLSPMNVYGESKADMEEVFEVFSKETDASFIGLRYCNVFGPGEGHKQARASMVRQLGRVIRKRPPKLFKYGHQERDFVYIKDVVRANLLAAEKTKEPNHCFSVNCGSGKSVSFNDIANFWMHKLEKEWEIQYIENPYKHFYQSRTLCDMELAKEKIGFIPEFDVYSGILDYIKYEQF